MAALTIYSEFGAPKNKVTVSTVSPSICHEVMGMNAMTLVFWMLSVKPTFSLSSFTFIKRLFSSSSLPATREVSSAYLRLLILVPGKVELSPARSQHLGHQCHLTAARPVSHCWPSPTPSLLQSASLLACSLDASPGRQLLHCTTVPFKVLHCKI